MKNFIIVCLVAIAYSSYSQTKVKSGIIGTKATMFENKDFKKHEFNKIIVNTGSMAPDWDKKIIDEFKDLNVKLVSWLTFFPPVKDYSEEETKKILIDNSIDGVITITKKADKMILAQKQSEYELFLMDVASNMKAVTFVGSSQLGAMSTAAAPEKTTLKFVRVIHDDLKKVMTP